MTFGAPRWGATDEDARQIFDRYIDAGGNFVDTADVYAGGRSESLVGSFIAARELRDKVVLATKFAFNAQAGNPNAGGNGRKNIHRAIDGSLKRLGTDYIDLYWLHAWDRVTPVEEVLQSMGDLIRMGKIRYFALSDTPAWYATKAATLAAATGIPGPVALQVEYSLTERSVEREHLPAAQELGLGVTPWSPLAGGFLAGKYQRAADTHSAGPRATGDGRLSGTNPFGDSKFTPRNWGVLELLLGIAQQLARTPAQIALAWLLTRDAVTSPILGIRTLEQMKDNVGALDVHLNAEHLQQLDAVSQLEPAFPYAIYTDSVNRMMFGGVDVAGWRR